MSVRNIVAQNEITDSLLLNFCVCGALENCAYYEVCHISFLCTRMRKRLQHKYARY